MRKTQLKYLELIRNEFQKVAVWESNRLKDEPIGVEGLRALAREVYSEDVTATELLYPSKK
jgi:hypothetical protein